MSIVVAGGSDTFTAVEYIPIKIEGGKLIFGSWSVFGYLQFARPKYPSIGVVGSNLIFVGGNTNKNLAKQHSKECSSESKQLKPPHIQKHKTQKLSSNELNQSNATESLNEISYDLIENCWTIENDIRIKTVRYDHSTALVTKTWCKTVQSFRVS